MEEPALIALEMVFPLAKPSILSALPGIVRSPQNKHDFMQKSNFIGFPSQVASMLARTNGKVTTMR
jgi:hypothetical protein